VRPLLSEEARQLIDAVAPPPGAAN